MLGLSVLGVGHTSFTEIYVNCEIEINAIQAVALLLLFQHVLASCVGVWLINI